MLQALTLIFVRKSANTHTVECVLLNAQSLGNKLTELHYLLYSYTHQLILITESWLDSDLTNGLLDPENKYCIIRKDRNRNGGGVCAMVDKKLTVLEVCLDKCSSSLELVCFDVSCGGNSVSARVFVCYRPPGYSSESVNYMTDMIECLIANQHRSSANIITGDFNCPSIDWSYLTSPNDRIHRPFLDFVVHTGLVQTVAFPTRIGNILDLVLTDDPERLCSVATGRSFAHSDHDVVTFQIIVSYDDNDYDCTTVQPNNKVIFLWKKADFDIIADSLFDYNWY